MQVLSEAPGRVNIIGEHTDYNLGFVLPIAIDKKMSLKATSRPDDVVNVYAQNLQETASFSINNLTPPIQSNWWDYLAGVCWVLQNEGYELSGADINFGGDVPIGAGLSSSAALEVATAAAFSHLNALDIEPDRLAFFAQQAENKYIGVQCGIMDQFASALARKNHALFIDCRSLEYEHIPLNLTEHIFVIIDSQVKRSLAHSDYNRRREECEEALSLINDHSHFSREALRDVTIEEINHLASVLPQELYYRSRFVVEENQRVLQTIEAFRSEDLNRVGALMNDSHAGLRDLFAVSCPEVDLIVELAQNTEGVLGARMTGAGFGGCVVALAHEDFFEELKTRITEKTRGITPREPILYTTPPAAGLNVKTIG